MKIIWPILGQILALIHFTSASSNEIDGTEDILRLCLKLAEQDDLKLFNSLLDGGFDVNQSDHEGQTILFCLLQTMRSYPEKAPGMITSMIKEVVNRGADINHLDDWGNSCLHLAAYHGTPEVMKLFLEKGVKVNRQDIDGNTALHMVQPMKGLGKTGLLEKVELLMTYGADKNIKNNMGETPGDILRPEVLTEGLQRADLKEIEIENRIFNEVMQEKLENAQKSFKQAPHGEL